MEEEILNSSGKKQGKIIFESDGVRVLADNKPPLFIPLTGVFCLENGITEEKFRFLYDSYFLTIAEISAIFGVSYQKANKVYRNANPLTRKMGGRRNPSYKREFSPERLKKMSDSAKKYYESHSSPNKGRKMPEGQKSKISKTLKEKYTSGALVQDPKKKSEAWVRGCYDAVDFRRGVGGTFFSKKNDKKFLFRSLLELYYLIKLEEDSDIVFFDYESLRIPLKGGGVYTPDFLLPGKVIVELKSKRYLEKQPDKMASFLRKKESAEEWCQDNGFSYQVVWDEDLGFDSRRMKAELRNNPGLLEQYRISFFSPERIES